MHFKFEFHTSYLPVMMNKKRKEWLCCFETTDKRAAEEKAEDMRLFYKKKNGWAVSVQKKTTLALNNWEKEWTTEFFDMPEEWKPEPILNPFIRAEDGVTEFNRRTNL